MQPTIAKIEQLITPTLQAAGYELVRLQIQGAREPVLQIMAERIDAVAMTIDDCTKISHALSPLLEEHDPITSAYRLEVSSPGVDRPLTRPKDFERFAGYVAKIELGVVHEGRKRFTGRLLGLQNQNVQLQDEQQLWLLPLAQVTSAKLVLNEELLAAAQAGRMTSG